MTQIPWIWIQGAIAIQKYETFKVLHPFDLTLDAESLQSNRIFLRNLARFGLK